MTEYLRMKRRTASWLGAQLLGSTGSVDQARQMAARIGPSWFENKIPVICDDGSLWAWPIIPEVCV